MAKRVTPVSFAQGTQQIARIRELVTEPAAFVIEPDRPASPEQPEQDAHAADSQVTDAEIASAMDGEAPVAASRVKRAASAYTSQSIDIRPIIIVA